ncbi:serine hydrolase [Halomonas denitrificans]|nr:serine hydrolase [Halomonas denitrificans]
MTDFKWMIILLFLAGSRAAPAIDEIGTALDAAVAEGEVLSAAVSSWDQGVQRRHFVGALSDDDRRAPDGATRYQVGSITKAFTHLLLAERVAAGAVAYDTTIGQLLADEAAFENEEVAAITLEALATHTSGLPRLPANLNAGAMPQDPYAAYDGQALTAGIAAARAGQPLGKDYAYSNFGAGLLGWLLGREHGGGYRSTLEDVVLDPLRMSDTAFVPGDRAAAAFAGGEVVPAWTFDSLAGAGALWSTTDDLMGLAKVLLGHRGNPLAHDPALQFEPVADAGSFAVSRVWHIAETARGPVYWHNGGTAGHRSFFGVRPSTDQALVVLVSGNADPTALGLGWFGFEAREAAAKEIDESVLGQYALSDDVGIGVFVENGGLRAQLSGQTALPIEAIGGDWYRLTVVDASLHFLREAGEVVAVELVQNGHAQRAERVADRAAALDRAAAAIEIDDAQLDAFVGEYALTPQARFTVRRGGESGLEVRLTGQPFFPVFARGNDVFFYKVVDAELHFERGKNGEVNSVVLHQGGIVQRAERIESGE